MYSMATMVLGKLRANSHKQHWRELHTDTLIDLLHKEIEEFRVELRCVPIRPAKLAMEAADIVAILCMIVDNLRPESE